MKLVLVDRDGVINRELAGYVTRPEELDVLPAACEAFALLGRHGFTCAVVTNQSVVGRGIISAAELDDIHDALRARIERSGGRIDAIYACPDTPDAAGSRRKPQPGMLLEALERYKAVAGETPFIGDALTDMEAAHRAGCRRYLVRTGKGAEAARAIPPHLLPVEVCEDILGAAQKIVGQQAT